MTHHENTPQTTENPGQLWRLLANAPAELLQILVLEPLQNLRGPEPIRPEPQPLADGWVAIYYQDSWDLPEIKAYNPILAALCKQISPLAKEVGQQLAQLQGKRIKHLRYFSTSSISDRDAAFDDYFHRHGYTAIGQDFMARFTTHQGENVIEIVPKQTYRRDVSRLPQPQPVIDSIPQVFFTYQRQ